jgi:F420-0:gamma-glutamyl ligase-like protein
MDWFADPEKRHLVAKAIRGMAERVADGNVMHRTMKSHVSVARPNVSNEQHFTPSELIAAGLSFEEAEITILLPESF